MRCRNITFSHCWCDDAPQRLARERGAGDFGELERLSAELGPTGGLGDRPWLAVGPVELAEPGIGVGLQDPGVGGQMPPRVLGRPIAGAVVQGGWWGWSGKGPVVPHVGPEACRDRLAAGEQRYGGVVPVQALSAQDMRPDEGMDRREDLPDRAPQTGQAS